MRRFKVLLGQGSDQPIRHCPYCGHEGEGCWWTTEQADYLAAVASEELIGPELKKMARDFNRTSNQGLFKLRMDVKTGPVPQRPSETEAEMPILEFTCCNERIKHDGKSQSLNCIICGATVSA
jgi:hypothetical protein